MPRSTLGLDIGGANLKAAHSGGAVRNQPFDLWRDPAGLPSALRNLLGELPAADLLAVTMTGELCDCFESKRQGVHAILDAVQAFAGAVPVRVWQTDGRLVEVAAARAVPLRTAAANWLALATFAGRYVPSGPALLIDIGSTTTDIIPLLNGKPVPKGRTDPERLRSLELVYTGVRRTPLCALLGGAGAAEVFATTLDVFLVLGQLPENAEDKQTADGRPATRAAAEARLARMLCADLETSTADERRKLAERALLRQTLLLQTPIKTVVARLPQPPRTVVLAGSGEFLARAVLQTIGPVTAVSLAEKLGPEISKAACAHALAVLAAEQLPD
jgi:(4-(4-[2-(gamma-L-glutamylamino)ethyl]phenoxymethyl)furan-2-yl)methanamine synthase